MPRVRRYLTKPAKNISLVLEEKKWISRKTRIIRATLFSVTTVVAGDVINVKIEAGSLQKIIRVGEGVRGLNVKIQFRQTKSPSIAPTSAPTTTPILDRIHPVACESRHAFQATFFDNNFNFYQTVDK